MATLEWLLIVAAEQVEDDARAAFDAATANGADADRPQLRCSVELAR